MGSRDGERSKEREHSTVQSGQNPNIGELGQKVENIDWQVRIMYVAIKPV